MSALSDRVLSLRAEIDRTDDAIVALVERRAELAVEIARLKSQDGQMVRDIGREQAIFERILAASKGVLLEEDLRSVQSEVMRVCRKAQARAVGGDNTHPAEAAAKVVSKDRDL